MRKLHIDAALQTLNCSLPPPRLRRKAVKTPYFDFQPMECCGETVLEAKGEYLVVCLASGEATLGKRRLRKEVSFLMLPGAGAKLCGERFTLLLTRVKVHDE
jgi:hypothetical protein